MVRVILLFVWLGVMALTVILPSLIDRPETRAAAQYDLGAENAQYDLGAGETQYEEPGTEQTQYAEPAVTPTETGCDWYWGYRWNKAGAWEWWCWDPEMGWWYGTDETGRKQYVRMNKPGSFTNILRI